MPAETIRKSGDVDLKSQSIQALIAHFISFSVFGVLIRIYSGRASITLSGMIYPQIIGCFIIGWTNAKGLESYPHLKIGITTALCGSITSFSTFILSDYMTFTVNAWDGFVVIFIVVGLCFAAHRLGEHLATIKILDGLQIPFIDHSIAVIIFAAVFYIAMILISYFVINLATRLAVVLAPIGTILRWFLSRFNSKIPGFPLGTFIANFIGTFLLGLIVIAQPGFSNDTMGCSWMVGLSEGFCGCLTTISSFLVELLDEPKLSKKYIYGTMSIFVCLLMTLAILGGYTASGKFLVVCRSV